jgi:hypothetical protein
MNWNEPIDQFCERMDSGLWAEPLNAVSNAAFLVAAGFAYALWRRTVPRDLPVLILILLVFAVGIGSFLFHTFALRWAWFADVVPIGLFIAGYLVLALVRNLGLGLATAIVWLVAFEAVVVTFTLALPPDFINRAVPYLPALAALWLIGFLLRWRATGADDAGRSSQQAKRDRATARAFFLAAGLFTLSLLFRIVDLEFCSALPSGTHFLWHILNALVLYVLLFAAIRHHGAKRDRGGPDPRLQRPAAGVFEEGGR